MIIVDTRAAALAEAAGPAHVCRRRLPPRGAPEPSIDIDHPRAHGRFTGLQLTHVRANPAAEINALHDRANF